MHPRRAPRRPTSCRPPPRLPAAPARLEQLHQREGDGQLAIGDVARLGEALGDLLGGRGSWRTPKHRPLTPPSTENHECRYGPIVMLQDREGARVDHSSPIICRAVRGKIQYVACACPAKRGESVYFLVGETQKGTGHALQLASSASCLNRSSGAGSRRSSSVTTATPTSRCSQLGSSGGAGLCPACAGRSLRGLEAGWNANASITTIWAAARWCARPCADANSGGLSRSLPRPSPGGRPTRPADAHARARRWCG